MYRLLSKILKILIGHLKEKKITNVKRSYNKSCNPQITKNKYSIICFKTIYQTLSFIFYSTYFFRHFTMNYIIVYKTTVRLDYTTNNTFH